MLTSQNIKSMWSSNQVNFHAVYLSLPATKYPPGFISEMFGEGSKSDIEQELGKEFLVLETDHPSLKGQMTRWKVLRVEFYPGTDDCAYDFMAVCYCDRVTSDNQES